MAQRGDFDHRSNDELARLLYQNPTAPKPAKPNQPVQRVLPSEVTEPLASRRVSELGPQTWQLNERKLALAPVSNREEQALFAALTKGTRANQGREPSVPELMLLVAKVNEARALLQSLEGVFQGNDGIYLDKGIIVFSGSALRRLKPMDADAA